MRIAVDVMGGDHGSKVVIDGDRETDIVVLEIALHLVEIVLVGKLRRMDADHHEPLFGIFLKQNKFRCPS